MLAGQPVDQPGQLARPPPASDPGCGPAPSRRRGSPSRPQPRPQHPGGEVGRHQAGQHEHRVRLAARRPPQQRQAAARAPALTRVRAGSVAARRARRRGKVRDERPWGRLGGAGPATRAAGAGARRSVDASGGSSRGAKTSSIGRGPTYCRQVHGTQAVPGPAAALVEGVPAQLGVAGRGLAVVLAQRVAAAAQRGHRRGRGGRRRPSRPATKPTASSTPPTSRLIGSMPRAPSARPSSTVTRRAPEGAVRSRSDVDLAAARDRP